MLRVAGPSQDRQRVSASGRAEVLDVLATRAPRKSEGTANEKQRRQYQALRATCPLSAGQAEEKAGEWQHERGDRCPAGARGLAAECQISGRRENGQLGGDGFCPRCDDCGIEGERRLSGQPRQTETDGACERTILWGDGQDVASRKAGSNRHSGLRPFALRTLCVGQRKVRRDGHGRDIGRGVVGGVGFGAAGHGYGVCDAGRSVGSEFHDHGDWWIARSRSERIASGAGDCAACPFRARKCRDRQSGWRNLVDRNCAHSGPQAGVADGDRVRRTDLALEEVARVADRDCEVGRHDADRG
jgi:hypothetical protein